MIKTPLVSVVMTAYNAEKFISESINSVLNQSWKDFEFLIIDDCSSDKTPEIIKSFNDERIIFYKKSINSGFKGYVENLNTLIEKSKGKYIARIDADDIWHIEKLEKQIDFLTNNPDIALSFCHKAHRINENGKIVGIFDLIPQHTNFEEYFTHKNPAIHPSIVFVKEKITTKYRWKLFYAEDYDFHLINFSRGIKYHCSDEILMDYRVVENSLSHQRDKTLISALFTEQTKIFYHERIKNKGKDSYDSFNPTDILNIKNIKYKNEIPLLLLALRFSFIANLANDFKIILKKIKIHHPTYQIPILYRIISWNFNLFYKLYQLK